MTRRFTRIAILGSLVGLAGVQLPASAQDEEIKPVVIIDLRPAEQKNGAGLVELKGKCNDGVYRIADVASDPVKLDLLKADLSQQLRLGGEGKTLTVLDWSIYYNKQVQSNGVGLRSVGIQGYTIPGKKKERRAGSKCPREETAGGWYEESEIHSLFYPLVSEFTGTFAGKPVTARIVYSPRQKLEGRFTGGAADTQALIDAVHQTAEEVASAIDR
ncbi:MAG TPA: hypothetical protein VMF52_19025 [Steroidobacteraceae bacterium]|nr:hypothetical protein [Steroidobacteraceae bacterium]